MTCLKTMKLKLFWFSVNNAFRWWPSLPTIWQSQQFLLQIWKPTIHTFNPFTHTPLPHNQLYNPSALFLDSPPALNITAEYANSVFQHQKTRKPLGPDSIHPLLTESLCQLTGSHRHSDLQHVSGAVWDFSLFQRVHHHPGSQESHNKKMKYLLLILP